MLRPPPFRLTPTAERRLAQQLADDAEAGTVAAYERARTLARLVAEAAARADALARLDLALRSAR